MPAPHSAPVTEDIDEPAARHPIRVTLIVVIAALLLPMLGILDYLRFGDRPGRHHSTYAWLLEFILTVMVIMVGATALVTVRQTQCPRYRRMMQYGWRRRYRVAKSLRRGRVLSPEDMPVATAIMEQARSQRPWLMIIFGLQPIIWLLNGLLHDELPRWFGLGFAALCLVPVPFLVRQQRQTIRNYKRQNTQAVSDHQGDAENAG